MVLLRRTPGTRRDGARAAVLAAAGRLSALHPEATYTARELWEELKRQEQDHSWPVVRRLLSGPMVGRPPKARAGRELVEVTPGRFRLRAASEEVREAPLTRASPMVPPAVIRGEAVAVPAAPVGCRAAILDAAAAVAAADPDGLVRNSELVKGLRARGHRYALSTVQENLSRMTGREYAGHRAFADLERVRVGVYRLRPQEGGPTEPRAQSCRTDVIAAVRRLADASGSPDVHINAVRAEMAGSGYSDWTIRATLRCLVTGERGAWQALERTRRGWYRLRPCPGRAPDELRG